MATKFPLVGAAYNMNAKVDGAETCINWYPQKIESGNSAYVSALYPTAGLKPLFTGDNAPVRCIQVLSDGSLLVVIGKKLYHSTAKTLSLQLIGSITGVDTVRITDNGTDALIVNGSFTYTFNLKTKALTRLTGSSIVRSSHTVFLDGRFVVNKASTGQFYWTGLYNTTFDPLNFATAEGFPDNIVSLVVFNRELWLFGTQSFERYYSTGDKDAPFQRINGAAFSYGCAAANSLVTMSQLVVWLGISEFGSNQVVASSGGLPERISTNYIEEQLQLYTKISDAIAFAYQEDGHIFYMLTLPSADRTFCYDFSTGLWHERAYSNELGRFERHRAQHHGYFNRLHIVGDRQNGKLYALDKNTGTDNGQPIMRERTTQVLDSNNALTRFNRLEIVCEVGEGGFDTAANTGSIWDSGASIWDGGLSVWDIV